MISINGGRKKVAVVSQWLQHVVCQMKRGKGRCSEPEFCTVTSFNTCFKIEKWLTECNLSLCLATWRQGGEGRGRDRQNIEPKGNSMWNVPIVNTGQIAWCLCITSLPEEFSGIKPAWLSTSIHSEPNSPAVTEGNAHHLAVLVSSRKCTSDTFDLAYFAAGYASDMHL